MKMYALALLLKTSVSCQISYQVKSVHQNDSRRDYAVLRHLILHTHSAEHALVF